jgi:FAD/FMN-containing dehydrogenase
MAIVRRAVSPDSRQRAGGFPAPAARPGWSRRGMVVNDVHSALNPTRVDRVVQPESVADLQAAIHSAAEEDRRVTVCGGRHAMGGQQFGAGTTLLDLTRLNRVVDLDVERGLVTVEAGIDWPRLVNHLIWSGAGSAHPWAIVQKQTGADRLTLGGALAANIHGRGLRLPPIVADVESFDLVTGNGELVHCDRQRHPDLFGLAIGGYGLLGVIARVTLRLVRRHKVERRVAIARVDDLAEHFEARIDAGFEYGDFQFATDPLSREFLQAGVFSCYRPVQDERPIPEGQRALSRAEWKHLLLLAHTDKSRAFAAYARYYMSTDGQIYWSDTHQLAEYIDDYHVTLDDQLAAATRGSEMISELYVPREALAAFMAAVREDARRHGVPIIYGTIRLIERDDETFLAWAREPWACVVVNLHVDHSEAGIRRASTDFRRLIDTAIEFGGSYYLTYHRWAAAEQVRRCHPRLPEFLRLKRTHDPAGRFASDWYTHHVRLLEAAEGTLS